jgi:phospholipid transport system transporter-binding protein
VTDFELHEEGEGRFALQGDMSFETANQILKASEAVFAQHATIQVDLSKVGTADSAGLALLLEWKAQVAARGASIQFIGMPDSLASVARTSEVTDLL